MMFPAHKCSLTLTHNQHRDYYESIAEYVSREEIDSALTPEEKQKCLETDEIWELQWYPDTPVGFYKVCGSTLEYVLAKANEV